MDLSLIIHHPMIIKALCNIVIILSKENLGVPCSLVDTHRIHKSFAMFLKLGRASDSLVMLKGRWKSQALLYCITSEAFKYINLSKYISHFTYVNVSTICQKNHPKNTPPYLCAPANLAKCFDLLHLHSFHGDIL